MVDDEVVLSDDSSDTTTSSEAQRLSSDCRSEDEESGPLLEDVGPRPRARPKVDLSALAVGISRRFGKASLL